MRPIREIAQEIEKDWGGKISPHARPYLNAMHSLIHIDDPYMADNGRSIVAYFLSNASSYKGETAKRIKKELNDMLKNKSAAVRIAKEIKIAAFKYTGDWKKDFNDEHPLLPDMIAETVAQNAIPEKRKELEKFLLDRFANTYKANKSFGKDILNGKGNSGRDKLYVYFEHWANSWLRSASKTKIAAQIINAVDKDKYLKTLSLFGKSGKVWSGSLDEFFDIVKLSNIDKEKIEEGLTKDGEFKFIWKDFPADLNLKGKRVDNLRGYNLSMDVLPPIVNAKIAGSGTVPNFVRFEETYETDDYPYGRERTKATFKVDKRGDNKERIERITIDPKTGRVNKPKYTTFASSAILGISNDNKVYPITGTAGQISVWNSDMQHQVASVFTNDPDYEKLAKALKIEQGAHDVQVKKTPTGAVINGLQGKSVKIREILEIAGLTPEQIADIEVVKRKDSFINVEWRINFKSNTEPYTIIIRS